MSTIRASIMSVVLCVAAACKEDGEGRGDGDGTGGVESSGSESGTIPTTTTPTTTTVGTSATTASTDPTDATDDGRESSTGDEPYEFEDGAPEEYTQVDRMGMPAVATALIMTKDEYNSATPADDAMAEFVPQIVDSLTALHAALDDDLAALQLTPCDVDTCAGQGAPLVVPDVIRIELEQGSGFPNGRRLEDPVIDITLAVILLDLEAHDVTTLVDVPVNPTENDEQNGSQFPYLPDPH